MNSCELISFVTAAACAIANCVPEEDIPMVAAILGQISATLATITVNENAKKKSQNVVPEAPDTELLSVQQQNIR